MQPHNNKDQNNKMNSRLDLSRDDLKAIATHLEAAIISLDIEISAREEVFKELFDSKDKILQLKSDDAMKVINELKQKKAQRESLQQTLNDVNQKLSDPNSFPQEKDETTHTHSNCSPKK